MANIFAMKLADYLSDKKIRPSAFAATLGVPPSTVMRWANGTRLPRLEAVAAIHRATDGAVTAEDFIGGVGDGQAPSSEGAAA